VEGTTGKKSVDMIMMLSSLREVRSILKRI